MACDVAARRTESLGKRSLNDVDARHHAVPLGVPRRLRNRSKSERSGALKCLREIAVSGSILCEFDQCFERLRLRGTAPGAHRGQSKLPNFFKMLTLLSGTRDALR
jgi:hypothetical protein